MKSAGAIAVFCLICLFVYSTSGIAELRHFPTPVRSPNNMSVIIHGLEGIEYGDGDELACFTPDNQVAGATVLEGDPNWGMSIMGDEPLTEEDEGFDDGENLRFLFWSSRHNWELEVSFTEIEQHDMVYHTDAFRVFDFVVSVHDDEINGLYDFRLESPYPNPFNPTVNIDFSLPAKGDVRARVFDTTGRLIEELTNQTFDSGKHQIIFNGAGLESGVYFVRLQWNGRERVARAVFLK